MFPSSPLDRADRSAFHYAEEEYISVGVGRKVFLRYPLIELRHSQNNAAHPARPLVSVVVDGISSYGRAILRGVLRYANLKRRWQLHEALWRSSESPLGRWRASDGAILAGVEPAIFHRVRRRCKHVFFCSAGADPKLAHIVGLNDKAAGAMAADHLMNCRLERFAFYGLRPGQSVAHYRLEGFREALAARGHVCLESPVQRPSGAQWVTHAHRPQLMKWLRELPKPIGIMAFDDACAHDLAAACLDADIGVPEHVAIIGVNNDDLLCESAWPPLSSIEVDFSRMGYVAARHLDKLLTGAVSSDEPRLFTLLPPLGVVQRQSTSVLAVDDANLANAVRYIREHACDPCNVPSVLREVPVGRRWLERQFLNKLGRSPHDEITRVRVDTARRLLLQPEMSMPEIAERCGFSAVQNLTRTFRQIMQTTPAAYRRNMLYRSAPM